MNNVYKWQLGMPGAYPNIVPVSSDGNLESITAQNAFAKGTFTGGDFIVATYNGGQSFGLFTPQFGDGGDTLVPYVPESDGFTFQNTCFVAKNGNDANSGRTLDAPKLTFTSAIAELNDGPVQGQYVIQCLDGAQYDENLVIPPNFSIIAPQANLSGNGSDPAILIQDTSENYVVSIKFSSINSNGSQALRIEGAQSNLFCDCDVVIGDIYVEGGIPLTCIALLNSNITITSSGQMNAQVVNAINSQIIANAGIFYGNLGTKKYGLSCNDVVTFTANESMNRNYVGGVARFESAIDVDFELLDDLPVGANITVVQANVGKVRFIAGLGVTILSLLGSNVQTKSLYSVATAMKINDGEWLVSGEIESSIE